MVKKLRNILCWPDKPDNNWLPLYRMVWNGIWLPLGIAGVLMLICYNFVIGDWEEVKTLWKDYF